MLKNVEMFYFKFSNRKYFAINILYPLQGCFSVAKLFHSRETILGEKIQIPLKSVKLTGMFRESA